MSCTSLFVFSAICANATSLFIFFSSYRYTASRPAADHDEIVLIIDISRQPRFGSVAWIFQVTLRTNENFQQAHEQHKLASAA